MNQDFKIKVEDIPTADKNNQHLDKLDEMAEKHGCYSRAPRKINPRTGQIHAKVLPHVREELLAEAVRRGVQQGVILEEAVELYRKSLSQ